MTTQTAHGLAEGDERLMETGGLVPCGSLYREFRPGEHLSALVACTWERVTQSDDGGIVRVVPDGCVDLVWRDAVGPFIAGPDTGPVVGHLRAGELTVGLRFRPGAASTVLGLSAAELRDARVSLEEIWGARAKLLGARLAGAQSPQQKRAILEQEIAQRLSHLAQVDPLVLASIRYLGRPRARIEAISDRLGVSERHLQRQFSTAVGYGPKTLDRVLRFQRFLKNVRTPAATRASLARLARELGYADQAHLSRECQRLSGLTPRQLIAGGRGLGAAPKRPVAPQGAAAVSV